MTLQRRRKRVAAATVEMAIVIPIFFMFIFAMIEIGRGMMIINLLQHAARTACREGVLEGKSSTEITTAANNAIKNQGLKDLTVSVQVNGTVGEASTAASKARITVVMTAPIGTNSWLPGSQWLKGNISGQYSLPRE